MATPNLTKRAIKAFVYEGQEFRHGYSRDVRWDGALPGFGVRVYPGGQKAYLISYRTAGRKRLMTIGDCRVFTLDQARDDARAHLVTAKRGKDPLEERQKAAQGETFADLEAAYIERHAKKHKKTWETDARRLERHIPSGWKKRKVTAIKSGDVAALHAKIGAAHPYEANRTLNLLHTMFGLARVWGFLDTTAPNPAEGIKKFREYKRKRWAKPEEVKALAAAIDDEPNVFARGALWLYLLTATRRNELLAAKRAEVDWNRSILKLPDTKAGDEQEVALSGAAIAFLQGLPRIAKNPYLFPGAKKGRHFVNIDNPWRRVRDRATVILLSQHEDQEISGLVVRLRKELDDEPTLEKVREAATCEGVELPVGVSDLLLHDLRRSVVSWLTQSGVDLNTIKSALRHANIATTLTYAQLGSDPAREAMEAHGKRILAAAGKRGPVEVVKGGGAE